MRISGEGKFGIVSSLVGLLGTGALVVAPEWRWIGWVLIAAAVLGFVLLAYHHFAGKGRIRKMGAILGMGLGLTIFVFSLVWYFWQNRDGDIEWSAQGNHFGLEINASMQRGGPILLHVDGFGFGRKNISGNDIYQIETFIVMDHNNIKIPLYVIAEGQWIEPRESSGIPKGINFTVGCQMREGGPHCENLTARMTPEQYFLDFGAFTFTFNYDGKSYTHHFTVAELRRNIDEFHKTVLDMWKNNPLIQGPGVTRRSP